MKLRLARITLVIAAITAALWAVPAFALDETTTPVPNDCYAFGVQLQGMTATQAVAAIDGAVAGMPWMKISVDGRLFYFRPSDGLTVDSAKMVEQAYEPTTAVGFTIPTAYTLKYASITSWAKWKASQVYISPVNARYYAKYGRLYVYRGRYGKRLVLTPVITAMRARLSEAAASGEMTSTPLYLKRTAFAPTITQAKLPVALITDLSERRIRMYKAGRWVKTYRCAIGMRGYETPLGTWTVVGKRKNPSWANPGSDWAEGMPAYIPPGPTNPLGTRALYLNAPGIRIHGTSKRSSIGTAASHGCMRMLREDVEALYPLVPVGTKVFIVK